MKGMAEVLVLGVGALAATSFAGMEDDALVQEIGTAILGAAALMGLLFALIYTPLARWWETREGWYLMTSSLSFAAILSYNFASLVGWLDQEDRPWVRLIIYTAILLVMLWRGVLLIQAQLELWRQRTKKVN